jgi:hypothetical protein
MLNELNSRAKKMKSTAHAKKLALTARVAAHTNETLMTESIRLQNLLCSRCLHELLQLLQKLDLLINR